MTNDSQLLHQLVITSREMDAKEMQRKSHIDNLVFHLYRKGLMSTLTILEQRLLDYLIAFASPHQKVLNHKLKSSTGA